jgi:hypothetical protein
MRSTYLGFSLRMLWLAVAFLAMPIAAQWINYPTPGIPRTKDGKPNLLAPAPRTPDGKPDLSGVWEAEKRSLADGFGGSGPRTQQFLDIGDGLKGGLPYQPWAADLAKTRHAQNSRDNPDVRCLPLGILQMHTHPFVRKIVQVPGLLSILHERNMEYRQIFTDGRPLPSDPHPSWNGYSSGKWEGDTLVVQTAGFRDGLWADYNGSPLTDAAKMTERFRRVNFGKLEIEVTVDDPKAYTKPWTVKLNQVIALDTELLEYVCLENEKDVSHMVGK